ncbi:hypothetical protein D1007_07995 [Hordeum vulgare]|nr:hypothetical protein D1007_07995 [Hordeum vulgare]
MSAGLPDPRRMTRGTSLANFVGSGKSGGATVVGSRTPKPPSSVPHEQLVSCAVNTGVACLSNNKLCPTLNRITRLKATELTIQLVGADFLRRRIALLQKRDRFAWEYNGPADWMRLYTGTVNNLTVYGHGRLCDWLFNIMGSFHLPAGVVPLNINFSRNQILHWMPD